MTRETIQMQDIKGNKAIDYVNAQTAPEIQECFASYQTNLQREPSVIDTSYVKRGRNLSDEKEQDSMEHKKVKRKLHVPR